MDFSQQYEYLKSKGCTFTWDKAEPAWSFSKGHIIYKGSEIGTLEKDNSWINDTEGMCHQYSYNGWYTDQEFKSKVDELILVIDSGMPLEMVKLKIKKRDQIRGYFSQKRAAG